VLGPRERHLLLECLRPPEGYKLSQAVGTTYSLDLIALLTAPLVFTFFDWENNDGQVVAEPLALLEAVRRHADKILIFCHGGEIKVPPPAQRLVSYLEHSIIEVQPEKEMAVFHPKIWLLRYELENEPVCYRFLCLSRNLTFDCSWDSIFCMDGVLLDRQNAIGKNRPLGDFIAALPKLAVRKVSEKHLDHVATMADEVRRVQFTLPEGIDDYNFWPLGLSRRPQWPFNQERRPALIMSPFLSPAMLEKFCTNRNETTLISRAEELVRQPAELVRRFTRVFFLNVAADAEDEDQSEHGSIAGLSGLHAKLFIIDDGWNARVFTGSANATDAAFGGNVEFLVELSGRRKYLGIGAFLQEGGKHMDSFLELLQPWSYPQDAVAPDATADNLERQLTFVQRKLACLPAHVKVSLLKDGQFILEVITDAPLSLPEESQVTCWPGSLNRERAVQLKNGDTVLG